ncbi:MAG: PfkB family carbohydrate kinase [Hyphomicrobiales bacterium]
MTKVLCVGIATLDHVYAVGEMPSRAEKYRALDLAVAGGGTAATAAYAVARLGGKPMLATRLGDDTTAREIVAELEGAGVDCSLARRFAGHRSPSSAVFVDRRGERLVMCHADAGLPEAAAWLPPRLPPGTRAVLGDVSWVAGARRLFAAARAAGVPSVIDGDRVVEDPGYFDAASHVAYSAATVEALTGLRDPRDGLAALARKARNWIGVTDGERGVWFTARGAIAHEPAFAVTAFDTLGAGDVFHGALALALAEAMPERLAVRFANAAAALKCTRFGGGRAGAPSRAEVEAFMRERRLANSE